jgi:5-methylcytosine-specific restriction endonuclease McrA
MSATGPLEVRATRDAFGGQADPVAAEDAVRTAGRRRLTNLLAHLTAVQAGHTSGLAPGGASDPDAGGPPEDRDDATGFDELWPERPAPTLLLRAELDTFLGRSGQGAQLLTTLAGGAMHVDAATARRLAEHVHGLRLIVTDGGRVVGVCRRTSRPPRFLVDAIRAVHDTCSAPGCDRPVLTCQVDHAVPSSHGGPTDVANCGPLCGHDNRDKERAGWRARGEPDGTRHWHHPRSGLRVTTHPATKRPPPSLPDDPPRPPGRRSAATGTATPAPPWPSTPPDDPDG